MEQAFYLRQVLWSVGGEPSGPRGKIDEICAKLYQYNEDFKALKFPPERPSLMIEGSIYLNYSKKA